MTEFYAMHNFKRHKMFFYRMALSFQSSMQPLLNFHLFYTSKSRLLLTADIRTVGYSFAETEAVGKTYHALYYKATLSCSAGHYNS